MYYKIAVEVTKRRLEALESLLKKIETQAHEKSMSDTDILGLRLAPDMYPLVKQVQIVTDNAKGAASRLAGKDIPSYEDTESTFAELYARLEKTISYLDTFTPADFEAAANKEIELVYFKGLHFTGEGYLLQYHIPNLMFHVTTVYAICRTHGFQIGKADFMDGLPLIPNT